jgi:hypothetical protein
MREYTITYNAGFANGLRPNTRNPRNNQFLVMLAGAIPYDNVLSSLAELPEPISVLNTQWPFPQLFHLRRMTLVATESGIYEFKNGVLTLLCNAVPSNSWSVADFGEYIVLTNGSSLITRDPLTGVFAEYLDCKIPPCLCVCEVNSQLLVGGIL